MNLGRLFMYVVSLNAIRQIPDDFGIYKIYAYTFDNKPIVIQRFAKADESGLIYIGHASRQFIKKRLENFEMTARKNSNTTNHSGALKYRSIHIISKILGAHILCFEYEICNNPKLKEKELLFKYRTIFGDTPLLNG